MAIFHNVVQEPWVVIGDSSVITEVGERINGDDVQEVVRDFRQFIYTKYRAC